MTIPTDRATVEEKVAAWDRFMGAQDASTGDAAVKAWLWLHSTVEAREAAQRVAKDGGQALEAENVVQFRVVRTDA
jgi:hypothetical protein